MTKVVNLYKEKYDVYIGRPGKGQKGYFGNPFPLTKESDREKILLEYKNYFYSKIKNDKEFESRVSELKDKILGCFCHPKNCHGDIIAEYLNNLDN